MMDEESLLDDDVEAVIMVTITGHCVYRLAFSRYFLKIRCRLYRIHRV
jgi:hypothetical protein